VELKLNRKQRRKEMKGFRPRQPSRFARPKGLNPNIVAEVQYRLEWFSILQGKY
jgi:hypothetical protein